MNKILNKKGTLLIEVMIALAILVMAGLAIATLMTSSMRAGRSGSDKFIASHLAREGVEGVISMVGTNWLRFPGSQDSCWNVIDSSIQTSGQCPDVEMSDTEHYILAPFPKDSSIFNNNNTYFKWTLSKIPLAEPNNTGLKLISENISGMLPYCLFREAAPREGLLIQKGLLGQEGDCSGFYREITVSYPGLPDKTKEMKIMSKVQWLSGSETRTVMFDTTLYNRTY